MIKDIVKNLKPSSTLRINEISQALELEGKKVFKFGFGQSPFQIPDDVVDELKIKNINVFEADYGDLPNLSKVNFNNDDLKLIDDKAKKIISEFLGKVNKITHFKKENLELMINDLIKTHETNFKGVGQPLRIALIGSKFGPGIYDIIISLGKEEVAKRLENKIFS